METKEIYFLQIAALCTAVALSGCATTGGGTKEESPSVIKERSTQRWSYLIAHQADKAYDLLSPGYRQTKTRDQYAHDMNERGIHWEKVSYVSQECEDTTCRVRLTVDYNMKMPGAAGTVKSTAPLLETWIKSDGKWYYLPDAASTVKRSQTPA